MTSVSPPPTDIFYNILFSDMPCYSDKKFKGFFHENDIELCDISGMSLKEMTAEVVNFLDDTDRTLPARVLVSIFNMTAGLVSNNILEDFAGQIMAAIERNSLNEVSFAQVLFRPAIEDSWDLIVQFNSHLKRLNKQNNVKTFDINNPIVKYFDKLKKDRRERVLKRFDRQALTDFHVKPFWNEHLLQTGLGHTLTPDGVRRVTNFIIKMYKTNFQFSSSEDYLETLVPRSLVETPWFRDIYDELKRANNNIYKGLRCLAVRNINEDIKVDYKIAPTVRVELTHNNEKATFDNFPVDIKVSDRKVVILNHEVSNAINVENMPTRIVKLTDNEPNIKNPPRRVLLNENSGLTIHTNGTGVQSDQIFKTDNFIDNNDSDMFDKREEIEALIRKNLALKLELEREKLELNNIALREGRIGKFRCHAKDVKAFIKGGKMRFFKFKGIFLRVVK